MKASLFLFGFVLFVGAMVGRATAGTDVEYRTVEVPKTETVTETVEVPAELPDMCTVALSETRTIFDSAQSISDSTSVLLDYLSRIRLAASTGDSNEANVIETELRDTQSDMLADSITLGRLDTDLTETIDACFAAIGE